MSTETWLHASVTQSRAVCPGSARSPRPRSPGDGLRGLRFAARAAPWAAEGTGPRAADGRCRSAVPRAGEVAPTQLPRRPALLRQIPTSCRFGAHDAAWCCESGTPGEPAACVSVRWLPSQRSSSSPSLPFPAVLYVSARVLDAETFSCARQHGCWSPHPLAWENPGAAESAALSGTFWGRLPRVSPARREARSDLAGLRICFLAAL